MQFSKICNNAAGHFEFSKNYGLSFVEVAFIHPLYAEIEPRLHILYMIKDNCLHFELHYFHPRKRQPRIKKYLNISGSLLKIWAYIFIA